MNTVAEIKTAAHGTVISNPGILNGVPVFRGTRLPVKTLFDHLEAGDPLAVFLDDFPDVSQEQAKAMLRLAFQAALDERPVSNIAAE